MMELLIKIIGGVCGGAIGTFLSGKIYGYIYNKPQITPIPYSGNDNTIKESIMIKKPKSFEDILKIRLQQHVDKYDNFNDDDANNKKITFVNNALYDNNFEDYYALLALLGK
jgi:hypothetical protein